MNWKPHEIASIKLWIDQGAKLDQDVGQLQALHEPEIPKIKPAPVAQQIGAVAFSPDGTIVAAGGYGEVSFSSASTRKLLGKLTGITEAVRTVAFSRDGKYFAVGAGRPAQEGEIKIWQTGESFWTKPAAQTIKAHRDCVYALAFSPDSKLLASTSYDHMIYLWDPATGKQVKPLKEHTDSVFDLAFSPDGKWLASGGADRTVKLWDVASGKRIHTMGSSTEGVNTVAFHPNGKYVAASGFDRTIRVWDISVSGDPVEIHSVIAHEEPILRLAYSPDGRWMATTGWDKLVKIWDTKKMEQVRVIPGQSDWILSMSFFTRRQAVAFRALRWFRVCLRNRELSVDRKPAGGSNCTTRRKVSHWNALVIGQLSLGCLDSLGRTRSVIPAKAGIAGGFRRY